jgi:hypothetical protein
MTGRVKLYKVVEGTWYYPKGSVAVVEAEKHPNDYYVLIWPESGYARTWVLRVFDFRKRGFFSHELERERISETVEGAFELAKKYAAEKKEWYFNMVRGVDSWVDNFPSIRAEFERRAIETQNPKEAP